MILKYRIRRKTASGTSDTLHIETETSLVLRPDGTTAETSLTTLENDSHAKTTVTKTTSTSTLNFGGTFDVVDSVETSSAGHVNAVNTKTLTLPSIPSGLPAIGGDADTAAKLKTARIITLSGDATGSTTFDGSDNVEIPVTVADDSHNHTIAKITGLQSALDGKQPTITGAASTIVLLNLSANKALITNADGKVTESTVTSTELGYLSGVTSKVQTQLDNKAPIASPTFIGTPNAPTANSGDNTTQIATTAFVQTELSALLSAKDAFRFVGKLAAGDTLPAADAGCVYRITSDGTINGLSVHEGDTATCCVDGTSAGTPANWFITHTNHDGQVMGPTTAVDTHVAVFDGSTGKLIKDSGFTIGVSVPADAKFTDTIYTHPTVSRSNTTSTVSPTSGGTFTAIDSITTNTNGHVTAVNTKTVTLPSSVAVVVSASEPTGQKEGDLWYEPVS